MLEYAVWSHWPTHYWTIIYDVYLNLNSNGGRIRKSAEGIRGDHPWPLRNGSPHGSHGVVGSKLVDEALDADQGADSFEILKFKDFFKIIVRVIKSLFKLSVAASQLI